MTRKRIAMVSAWYPPTNGVAVSRMKAFARFLSEQFIVEVFTLGQKKESVDSQFGTVHYSPAGFLSRKLSHSSDDGKLLHHSKTIINLLLMQLNVSKHTKWQKLTQEVLFARHKEEPFDLIISSYSPVEPHDIAMSLKTKYPDLLWIADMRDEMSSNPFLSDSEKLKLLKKEQSYANHLDGITTVSAPILEDFKRIFSGLEAFEEIRNGFDHEIKPKPGFNDSFTIVHAGKFYGKRKPGLFFSALVNALATGRMNEDFKIIFIGTSNNFPIPAQLKPFIEFVPTVEYEKAVRYMKDADCNLLLNPPQGTKGQFSGKVFDYLSVEKPILALVDTSDVAAALIDDHCGGVYADFYDVSAIEDALCLIYDYWVRKEHFPIKKEKTQELHRKQQVKKLVHFIEKLVNA